MVGTLGSAATDHRQAQPRAGDLHQPAGDAGQDERAGDLALDQHARRAGAIHPRRDQEMGAGGEGRRHYAGMIAGGARSEAQPPHADAARRENRARSAATQRMRHSRMFSIAISAAGVTIRVSRVAKPSPNTMAVERLIHHCVAGAPMVISRERNSMFMPKAIGSTPRIAVTAVSTTGRARSRQVSMMAS